MRGRAALGVLLLVVLGTGADPIAWAGSHLRLTHDVSNAVARYNADGTLDTTFNSTGMVAADALEQTFANAIALQADGKVVVGGADSDLASGSVGLVWRATTRTAASTRALAQAEPFARASAIATRRPTHS